MMMWRGLKPDRLLDVLVWLSSPRPRQAPESRRDGEARQSAEPAPTSPLQVVATSAPAEPQAPPPPQRAAL